MNFFSAFFLFFVVPTTTLPHTSSEFEDEIKNLVHESLEKVVKRDEAVQSAMVKCSKILKDQSGVELKTALIRELSIYFENEAVVPTMPEVLWANFILATLQETTLKGDERWIDQKAFFLSLDRLSMQLKAHSSTSEQARILGEKTGFFLNQSIHLFLTKASTNEVQEFSERYIRLTSELSVKEYALKATPAHHLLKKHQGAASQQFLWSLREHTLKLLQRSPEIRSLIQLNDPFVVQFEAWLHLGESILSHPKAGRVLSQFFQWQNRDPTIARLLLDQAVNNLKKRFSEGHVNVSQVVQTYILAFPEQNEEVSVKYFFDLTRELQRKYLRHLESRLQGHPAQVLELIKDLVRRRPEPGLAPTFFYSFLGRAKLWFSEQNRASDWNEFVEELLPEEMGPLCARFYLTS